MIQKTRKARMNNFLICKCIAAYDTEFPEYELLNYAVRLDEVITYMDNGTENKSSIFDNTVKISLKTGLYVDINLTFAEFHKIMTEYYKFYFKNININ